MMSTKTSLQPSGVQSIPLQILAGYSVSPDDNEGVQLDIDASQTRQESSEPQDEDQSASEPLPARTDNESCVPQPTNPTSAVDKWQIRLSVTQVLIGVLAFAGFLAMLYPQIIDHYINKDSLKLGQWTAWMTFRDECRALLSEARDIGPDCKEALHQSLPRPPIPMDESLPHPGKNPNNAIRAEFDIRNTHRGSTSLLVSRFSLTWPELLAGVFFLSLALGLWYMTIRRSSQRQGVRWIEVYGTWVADNVARLQPDRSKEYTTAQYTVSRLKTVRKRVTIKGEAHVEKQYKEYQVLTTFEEMPGFGTDFGSSDVSLQPLSHVADSDKVVQDAMKDENEEEEKESAWLPFADGSEDDTLLGYLHTVELILDKLDALGYKNFAFDRIKGHADLEDYLAAARQMKPPCDYSGWSESPSWLENLGTSCSIFPHLFAEYLKGPASNLHWLIEIPGISLDTATAFLTYTLDARDKGNWRCWRPEELRIRHNGFWDVPCLYVMSVRQRHVRLVFENMSWQNYTFIIDELRIDEQGHRPDCCPPKIPRWDAELHSGIIQKVFLAASEGSLDTYAQPSTQRDGGLMFEGSYAKHNWEDSGSGRLIPMKERDSNKSKNSKTGLFDVPSTSNNRALALKTMADPSVYMDDLSEYKATATRYQSRSNRMPATTSKRKYRVNPIHHGVSFTSAIRTEDWLYGKAVVPVEPEGDNWPLRYACEDCDQSFGTSEELSDHIGKSHYRNVQRSPRNHRIPFSVDPVEEPPSSREAIHNLISGDSQIARCTVCGKLCADRLLDFTAGTTELRKPMCKACLREYDGLNGERFRRNIMSQQ